MPIGMTGGAFTPNYEANADIDSPRLARVSVAAGVYTWLHSRVFACSNRIEISEVFLARTLGVDRKSVHRAVKRLESEGLIVAKARRGTNGGTVFSLANVPMLAHFNATDVTHSMRQMCTIECGDEGSLNGADASHDIERRLPKSKKGIVEFAEEVEEVVSHLNEKTGKDFRAASKKTSQLINARLCEGYAVNDLKRVIDFKASEWLSDSKMRQYLQPSTLFSQSHFDEYLNQSRSGQNNLGGANGRFDRFA